LAVDPAHACSLSVTVPHADFAAPAVPTSMTAVAAIARPAAASATLRRPLTDPTSVPPLWLAFTPVASRAPVPGDAIECDAEREDRNRCHDAQPECIALEPCCDLVAECPGTDETADHHDGEHHDDRLVDAEHDRVAGQRDLDLH